MSYALPCDAEDARIGRGKKNKKKEKKKTSTNYIITHITMPHGVMDHQDL